MLTQQACAPTPTVQLDPARQRLQLSAELIGSDAVPAAAEIVSLAIEALGAAGATG